MPDYSNELQNLQRKAPQAEGVLEAVSFEFQGTGLQYVKDYQGRELSLSVGGALTTFTAAGFSVDKPDISESGQQVISITFPSAGTEFYDAVNLFGNERTFFTVEVTFLEYHIQGKVVNTDPGSIQGPFYAFNISVDGAGNVTIQASTDNLKTYTAGDLYTYEKFYALRTL